MLAMSLISQEIKLFTINYRLYGLTILAIASYCLDKYMKLSSHHHLVILMLNRTAGSYSQALHPAHSYITSIAIYGIESRVGLGLESTLGTIMQETTQCVSCLVSILFGFYFYQGSFN